MNDNRNYQTVVIHHPECEYPMQPRITSTPRTRAYDKINKLGMLTVNDSENDSPTPTPLIMVMPPPHTRQTKRGSVIPLVFKQWWAVFKITLDAQTKTQQRLTRNKPAVKRKKVLP